MSNKAKGLALTFAIWILPAIAVAEMVSPWCGYGSVPEFGGAVGGASDIELNVGSKLILDADVDGNNYITATSDGTIGYYIEGSLVSYQLSSRHIFNHGIQLADSQKHYLGTDLDYWQVYNSTGTQFELWSTDVDTFGADGLVFSVDDGTDDVDFSGGINLNTTEYITFDNNFEGNDRIRGDANGYLGYYATTAHQIYIGGVAKLAVLSDGPRVGDNVKITFGVDLDYWQVYNSAGTQFELWAKDVDSGTGGDQNGLVFSVDDGTDDVDFSGHLQLANAEFIHNDTDGKITLGGSGGTNNEDLILDFETTANWVYVTSGTGVSFIDWGAMSHLGGNWRANAGGYFYWTGKTQLRSPADGQLRITNYAVTSGAVLDVDDAADTIVVKDSAGTGNGNLDVTGDLTVDGNQTYYGGMYNETTRTVTVSATDTPYQIVGPDPYWFTAMPTNGVSLANDELTVTNAGTYLITAGVSAKLATGGTTRLIKGYIYLDDGTPAAIAGCTISRALNSSQDVGRGAITCIATLAASDKLELWIENAGGAGTEDIEIEYASLTVTKL